MQMVWRPRKRDQTKHQPASQTAHVNLNRWRVLCVSDELGCHSHSSLLSHINFRASEISPKWFPPRKVQKFYACEGKTWPFGNEGEGRKSLEVGRFEFIVSAYKARHNACHAPPQIAKNQKGRRRRGRRRRLSFLCLSLEIQLDHAFFSDWLTQQQRPKLS